MATTDPGSPALTPIWEVEPLRPRNTARLDRVRIVTVAIGIADTDGMDAVTIRRVATDLGSGPMSLYRHLPGGKDDLIDLMLDRVIGEHTLAGIPSGNWAADLTVLGEERRAAALRHPWSIIPAARPTLGPNGMRRLEVALSIFGEEGLPAERRAWGVGVLDAYVTGAVGQELARHNEQTRTGMSAEDWQRAIEPYISRMLGTGDYPHIAEYVSDAPTVDPAEHFRAGLSAVTTGIVRGLR
ncbi:TetR/AcrR family transcriptional regulator [Luethyella okanaganae]|uniref:TetR/AcrR family transcriptional regulator n=1 Tax=Luethyella okanaganae TaxID=69372 RepID=A0ABW1VDY2_9MICO